MKAVDILRRIECVDDRRFVDLFWQRHLHQNPINVLMFIQLVDDCQQVFCSCRVGQVKLFRFNSNFSAGTNFVSHIDRRSIIISNQHGAQARLETLLGLQPLHFLSDFVFDLLGDRATVENFCAPGFSRIHRRSS